MSLASLVGTPYANCLRVTSYAEVEEALRSPAAVPRYRELAAPFEGDTILKLHGTQHRDRRKLENALVRPEALSRYECDLLGPTITRVIAGAAQTRDADGVVRADLVDLSRQMVTEMTASIIGLDGVTGREIVTDVLSILGTSIEGIKIEWYTGDQQAMFERALANKQRYWDQYIEPALTRRRAIIASGDQAALPTDLLSLIALQDGTPEAWDDDLIRRECTVWLVGIGATTPTMVTHLVVDLAAWLAAHPEDVASLADDAFLTDAVNESIRLHPPAIALLRDYPDGHESPIITIAPGGELFLDIEQANRDTSVFGPDAAEFNPRRALPDHVKGYGLSFGWGKHLCLGLPVAVGGRGAGTTGAALLMIKGLIEAGVRLDPERPPVRPDTVDDRYLELPVVFERL